MPLFPNFGVPAARVRKVDGLVALLGLRGARIDGSFLDGSQLFLPVGDPLPVRPLTGRTLPLLASVRSRLVLTLRCYPLFQDVLH